MAARAGLRTHAISGVSLVVKDANALGIFRQ
jgi:hypothetical protein